MREFNEAEVSDLVKKFYNLNVRVKPLNGYEEKNYLLVDGLNLKYILKIADDTQEFEFLKAQAGVAKTLAESDISGFFQKYIRNNKGSEITLLVLDGCLYYMRILEYLEGTFWVDQSNKPDSLYFDLGGFLGKMDRTLKRFSHPALRRYCVWDIRNAGDSSRHTSLIVDHEKRRIVSYFLLQFETQVLPKMATLRQASIHNDANDYNILLRGAEYVCGLIDFGDMVFTTLINNVAIACTYAMLDHEDPLKAASLVIRGYNKVYPLYEDEVQLLYYLIAARLCISVTQSAYNADRESRNDHHYITEQPAWALLFKLIRINPTKAEFHFRKACGFDKVEIDDHGQILNARKKYIGRNLSISYKENLKIIRGAFQYLYDDKGDTYVDCVNNPSHVGHCHPHVVKRMQQQIAILNTNTRYLHNSMIEYAKRLTSKLPPELCVCYFVNSGTEANDLAVRMSRHFTGNDDIIVLDHAYHGTSTLAMDMSPYKFDGKGGGGKKPWVHKAVSPDLYRGTFTYRDDEAGLKYALDVQRIINELKTQNKSPAVFICETLLGVGGQMPLPAGYLKSVYEFTRAAGGLCIADEVQVGFGRVGESFWGFELQDVIPDIVVMGKPIGNGHPLAAVIVTEAIADKFNNGMEYFNTYGGNPVSMETGLAVLEVIEKEELQAHAKKVGDFLMRELRKLMEKYQLIGDVRGSGLFIGVELVKNRTTGEPAVPEIDLIVEMIRKNGYLLSTDGPLHNVLKIKPPLTFNKTNAEELVGLIDEALANF